MKIFQSALPSRLRALVTFINNLIGKFPRHRDHVDAVLLFDPVGHLAQFFAPHMRAAEAQQPLAVVEHRLDHL